ncbi:trypsin-like peptidase domain-containing protein [Saccharopolyspora erythraea]|nr:trypsin-like peptidase domain-containing protein [Saccharopolyspora erythraea]
MNPVDTHRGNERSSRNRALVGVVALALVAGLVGGGVGGVVGFQLGGGNRPGPTALDQPRPARSASTAPAGSVQQVAEKVLPTVVQLQVQSSQGSGEGSGIVLSPDGYILTNNHVAEGARSGRMTALFHDNRTASVTVVGTDPNSDLAVIKADIQGLTPASLGRSDDLPVGAPVVAVGSPFGLSGTVTSGIISAKDRPVRAGGESGSQSSVLNALQTDAAINPGNSGGPLVDMDGNVVGINSAIYSPGSGQEQAGSVGLGFAIPIDQAQRTSKELVETGSATQTTLGVRITPAERPGAVVVEVVPGGAAEAAGIRPDEVITKLGDRAIQDPDELIAAVRSHAPGEQVQLTTTDRAGGGERTVTVTLAGEKG